jgi:hypothetical protein
MITMMSWIKPQIARGGEGGGGGGGGGDGFQGPNPDGSAGNSGPGNVSVGGDGFIGGRGDAPSISSGPSGKSSNSANAGLGAPAANTAFGGYDSIGDMFDGGGPGQSGSTFGGALGGISNAVGATPYGSGIEATGVAGAVSSPAGRAALGALTGGIPGAVLGYAAATNANNTRGGRDPDAGIMGLGFGTAPSGNPGLLSGADEGFGGGGERGIIADAATDVTGGGGLPGGDPCPEGYIFDEETMTCIIDPDLGLTPEMPAYRMDPVMTPPENYTQPTSGFIPTPLQPNMQNPLQMQLNQLNQALRQRDTPAQPQMRGLAGANTNRTGIMGAP